LAGSVVVQQIRTIMDFSFLVPLITLIALEVVLGIDNVIFISILANKLPPDQQKRARRIGLLLAAVMRLGLLLLISWIIQLDKTLFSVGDLPITGKGLILIAGGVFLIYKATKEIYHKTEGPSNETMVSAVTGNFSQIIVQILIMDLVFSVDSIITAVGMVNEVWVMYVAVIITVAIMLVAAEPISAFVNKHPSFKILALAFLLLIGVSLISEGFGVEIPKGYIYFSMAFSFLVDFLQMKLHKNQVAAKS
jgi:predicted tellurium resistance membrane protein TerC